MRLASSVLRVDQDEQVPYLMDAGPKRLLAGKTPQLIDEWQVQPKLWNYIRHELDARKEKSQFILAGSSTPDDKIPFHSGAGRFTTVDVRTLSWQELGYSGGQASMKHLFSDNKIDLTDRSGDLETIVERIIKGGWPGLLTFANSFLFCLSFCKVFKKSTQNLVIC